MINLRSFEAPTVMKHSLGAIKTVAEEVRSLGLKRPLIVTDPGLVQAGLLERLERPLRAAKIGYVVFFSVWQEDLTAFLNRLHLKSI